MKKTEGGKEYGAGAYLIVPDAEKPSTWSLRIEGEPGVVSMEAMKKASSMIGKGMRGRKAVMTSEQRSNAAMTLYALFREHKVPLADIPAVLVEAVTSDSFAQMRAAIMSKKKKGEKAKTIAEALGVDERVIDVLSEAYLSCTYIAAMDGDAPSYETILAAVQAALTEKHKARHLDPVSTSYNCPSPHSWECAYRVIATFPGSAVYECMGALYQVSYTLTGLDAVVADDDADVVMTPKPEPGTMSEGVVLTEGVGLSVFQIIAPLTEGVIDREAHMIRDAVIMNAKSSNGSRGGGRIYSEAALKKIASMAEGAPCFANHVKNPDDAFKPRDIHEAIGKYKQVRYDASKQRVVGNLHIAEHQKDWVLSLAETMGDIVGNSPVTRGVVRMEGNTEIVDDIVALRSVDLVSDPATTRGLFEHREQWLREHKEPEGGDTMDIQTVSAFLKSADATSRKFLFECFVDEAKALVDSAKATVLSEAKAASDSAVKTVQDKLAATEKLLTEANATIDGDKAKNEAREKAARLDKMLVESDLHKKFGTLKSAITEPFKASLIAVDEKQWPAMIADRTQGLVEAAGSVTRPNSRLKDAAPLSEGREGENVPEGAHARFASAVGR